MITTPLALSYQEVQLTVWIFIAVLHIWILFLNNRTRRLLLFIWWFGLLWHHSRNFNLANLMYNLNREGFNSFATFPSWGTPGGCWTWSFIKFIYWTFAALEMDQFASGTLAYVDSHVSAGVMEWQSAAGVLKSGDLHSCTCIEGTHSMHETLQVVCSFYGFYGFYGPLLSERREEATYRPLYSSMTLCSQSQ